MPRYLVTSVSPLGGGVFLFDSTLETMERIVSGCFRGITLGPDGKYYAVTGHRRHHRVATHLFRITPGSWAAEDLGPIPWKGCHDLRWLGDAFYLAASTGNRVIRMDARLQEIDRLRLVEDDEDVCHVNCLARRGDDVYASIFTLSPGPRAMKRHTPAWTSDGKVVRLDFEAGTFEVCFEPVAQPHNLGWYDDRLYLVESHMSRLTRLDLAAGRSENLLQLAGFVRGLSIGADEAVVGVNQLFTDRRQRQPTIPLMVRLRERFFPFSGLILVDPQTWRIRGRVPSPGLETYDILPVDGTGS